MLLFSIRFLLKFSTIYKLNPFCKLSAVNHMKQNVSLLMCFYETSVPTTAWLCVTHDTGNISWLQGSAEQTLLWISWTLSGGQCLVHTHTHTHTHTHWFKWFNSSSKLFKFAVSVLKYTTTFNIPSNLPINCLRNALGSRDGQPECAQQLGHTFGNETVHSEFRHFFLQSYFGILPRIKMDFTVINKCVASVYVLFLLYFIIYTPVLFIKTVIFQGLNRILIYKIVWNL